jgi:hypothetical protein
MGRASNGRCRGCTSYPPTPIAPRPLARPRPRSLRSLLATCSVAPLITARPAETYREAKVPRARMGRRRAPCITLWWRFSSFHHSSVICQSSIIPCDADAKTATKFFIFFYLSFILFSCSDYFPSSAANALRGLIRGVGHAACTHSGRPGGRALRRGQRGR